MGLLKKDDDYDDPNESYQNIGVVDKASPAIIEEEPETSTTTSDDSLFDGVVAEEEDESVEVILPDDHPLKQEGSKIPSLEVHLKHAYETAEEKHDVLEIIVAEMFKNHGYKIKLNKTFKVVDEEESSDIYAEYDCGLHIAKIIIKIEPDITPEELHKVITQQYKIIHEDWADKIIMVTTSNMDDFKTENYPNMTLWDINKLKELESHKPVVIDAETSGITFITIRQSSAKKAAIAKLAHKTAKKHSGGLFAKKGKITVESIELMHYPYFLCEMLVEVNERQKVGMFKKKSVTVDKNFKVCIDGRTGQPITYGKNGVSYIFGYYTSLNEKKREVLRLGSKHKKVTVKEMRQFEIVKNQDTADLMEQSLIDYISDSPFIYRNLVPYPAGLKSFRSIPTKRTMANAEKIIEASIMPEDIPKILVATWNDKGGGEISNIRYPIYVVNYKSGENIHKEVYDGVTGVLIKNFPELDN